MSDEIKIVARGARYPRKYKKIRSVSLCDQDGQVVATVFLSAYGIDVDHLAGLPVNVNLMNGLGQYQLEGEPEARFSCPHCVGEGDGPTRSTSKKWADGSIKHYGDGLLKPVYRVVCKRCGGGLIE